MHGPTGQNRSILRPPEQNKYGKVRKDGKSLISCRNGNLVWGLGKLQRRYKKSQMSNH